MLLLGGAAAGAYLLYKRQKATPTAAIAVYAASNAPGPSIDCIPITTGAPGTSDGCGGIIPQPATTAVPAGGSAIVTYQALPAATASAPAGNPYAISGYYGGNYVRGG